MRKLQKRLVCVTLSILMLVSIVWIPKTMRSHADGYTVTITSTAQTVKVGDSFMVIVAATGEDIGLIKGALSLSGSATATVADAKVGLYATSLQSVYTFTATQSGELTIGMQVESSLSLSEQSITCNVISCTITISEQPTEAPTDPPTEAPTDPPTEAPTDTPTEAPTDPPTVAETLSSNGKLDALSVSPGKLSPAFSADVYWYEVYLDNDVTVLNVDAVTSDENATWVVTESRKELKVGKNYVGVKVTAQDGSIVWYEMYVYRAAGETDAPSDEPTQAPTNEPTETPTDEPTNEPTTEAEPADPLGVVIGNVNGKIQQTLGNVSRPEGFEETVYNYKGVEIEVLKGLGKDLILIPISDGTKTALYIYNKDTGGFYPYVGIQVTSALYTVLPFPANETVPAGYSLTTIDFQGTLVDAWVRNDAADKNYSVFYAMNWNGETALYRYDAGEKTLQRVVKSELGVVSGEQNPTVGPEESTGSDGNHQVSDDYLEYYEETLQRVNRRDTFMFILMVILLICMVAMYLLFVVGKDDKDAKDEDENASEEEESEEDESDEDEDKALRYELEDIQGGMADFMADFSETEDTSDDFQLDELQDDDLEDLDLNDIK